MFNIELYPEIIIHLKSISSRCYKHSSGWYEIFCPYCNDATRKLNPKHGHFHVAPTYAFAHCFRCGTQIGLHQLLLDSGFTNLDIIKKLQQNSGFTYNKQTKIKSKKNNINLKEKIKEQYDYFFKHNLKHLNEFKNYIEHRCFEINPIDFYLLPILDKNNQLGVYFLNYDGNHVTTRLIFGNMRYLNSQERNAYYFQDLNTIDEFENIVITEGSFDLINLYNYSPYFKNAFYISIGGNNYKGAIIDIIMNYLLIGKYNIHIVFDQGLPFLEKIINTTKSSINILNPEIKNYFYLPILTKDVSECMLLSRI